MKIGTTRVETFSDGVIAIIITIMVLSLKLPDINKKDSTWMIRHNLQLLLPYFITYAFSFMMIGIFWINHHHMFHLLEKTDESLLVQNLIFLFWMSLIPLTTAMIGANPKAPDAAAVYGAVLLMTTLSFAIMRSYTLKKNLVHKTRDREMAKEIRWVSLKARTKGFVGAAAYLLSVPLAYMSVYLSYIFFLIPPIIFFIPDGIDDESLAEKIEDKNKV
ncbi:MAG: TMEM175 family protein [Flavisolibacter sp.]